MAKIFVVCLLAESPQLNMNLDVSKAYRFRQTEDRQYHMSAAPRVGQQEVSEIPIQPVPVPATAPAKVYS